jgi:hypothetical protein
MVQIKNFAIFTPITHFMKRVLLLLLFLVSLNIRSQEPDSLKFAALDSLSYEQILDFYVNEPIPPQFYKGPVEIGDSTYKALNEQVIPTDTVAAEPLFRYDYFMQNADAFEDTSTIEVSDFKPKIALGFGKLGYTGDLYSKHFQPTLKGRPAISLAISQRLFRFLELEFNVVFGKVGASENLPNRHENMVSEIRSGGVNLMYDFGNLIPQRYRVRPYVSFGVSGFEYLSKTDIKDANGNTYYYWQDGSIKNMPEGAAGAQEAKDMVRDYVYESDIRELNRDGFGKYNERSIAFPLGFGILTRVTERVNMKLNWQYYFSGTDYIDGITENSLGNRKGNSKNDNFSYASFSFQYDLIAKPKSKTYADTLSDAFWLAFDNADADQDSVPDLKDDCLGTTAGAEVDLNGCPTDSDGDGIPNYRDEEPNTPAGFPVNAKGIAQTDAYWKDYYEAYLNDTLSTDREIQVVYNAFAAQPKKGKKEDKKDEYTVELVRYNGPIPTDELAYLLSIGDIISTTLDDGTVVYTTGKYDNLADAVKRKDEFKLSGNSTAKVAKIAGKKVQKMQEEDIDDQLRKELEDLMSITIIEDGDTIRTQMEGDDYFAGLFGDEFNNATPEIKDSLRTLGMQAKAKEIKASRDLQESEETFNPEDVIYRVQLGAFKNRISTSIFNTSASVLELKTSENIYRYVTKGYKSIAQAASIRADLVVQGYSDAFVTAYKGGKRIPLNQTKATVDETFVEDMNEDKIFSSVDKSLVAFKVQLGVPLKKPAMIAMMEEKIKDLNSIEKQTTSVGGVRYTSGSFASYSDAEKHRKELEAKGFTDAFTIATFKNEQIPIQEAMELLK